MFTECQFRSASPLSALYFPKAALNSGSWRFFSRQSRRPQTVSSVYLNGVSHMGVAGKQRSTQAADLHWVIQNKLLQLKQDSKLEFE